MEARSVLYNVIKRIIFYLLRREVMDEVLVQYITNYSETGDAAKKIC